MRTLHRHGAWGVGRGLESESRTPNPKSSRFTIPSPYPSPRPQAPRRRFARGVTLIELVLSITIVAISVAAILGVLSMLSKGSAEAMIRSQAVAIAQAYLEEITLKSYADPDGVADASRAVWDDVSDYNGLNDVGARDQLGNPIVGLEQYTVTVTVGAGTLPSIAAASVRRIDVRVQHPRAGVNMTLSAYRTAL